MQDRKVKQVLYGGWYQWEGEKNKEMGRRTNVVENGKM
jgi:hypothetical protein